MDANIRAFVLYVVIVLLMVPLTRESRGQNAQPQDISFSQLLFEGDQGRVRDVLMQGPEIQGTFTDGRSFRTYAPNDPTLIQRLYSKGVVITARSGSDNIPWQITLLYAWLPVVVYGLLIFFFRILLRIQHALEKLSNRGVARCHQSQDRRRSS
jgi:cell division protease FtsH